ncbi:MAG: hypothetical protein HY203_03175 [Nitrospirae bacterium]|nr:hypothetical protein [Nitrospirota bacterium]
MPKQAEIQNIIEQGRTRLQQVLEETGLKVEKLQSGQKPYDFKMTVRRDRITMTLGAGVSSSGLPRFILEFAGATGLKRESLYPVFVAPYVSPRGAQILKANQIGFCDLAGNCYLVFGTVLISKTGAPNPLPARKEARALFSPRASRIIRAFLSDPLRGWLQKDLSEELKLSLGYLHSVIVKLLEQDYLLREGDRLYLKDRKGLLSAWAAAYQYTQNETREFYSSREPEEFEETLDQYCKKKKTRYALTLFAGARYRAPFVRYPRVHAYFEGNMDTAARELDLKPVPTGASVVILIPYDEGVFYKMQRIQNRNIVSDVQLYLDLQSAKGRAEEQAAALGLQHLQYLLQERTPEQEARLHEFLRLRDSGQKAEAKEQFSDAARLFEEALSKVEGRWDENTESHKAYVRLRLWRAYLEVAAQNQDKKLLTKAESLFPSDEAFVREADQLMFNPAMARYAALIYSAQRFATARTHQEREAWKKKANDYYTAAVSPYTEGCGELKERAESIVRLLRQGVHKPRSAKHA